VAFSPSHADLETLAYEHNVSAALFLGLGAGLYFEYLRRLQPSPTHCIRGLQRELDLRWLERTPRDGTLRAADVRAALLSNALWFNLDRAPTTALLGMEMLAEELATFDTIPDWQVCIEAMAETIHSTGSLYRRVYVEFLREISDLEPLARRLSVELSEIAEEWDGFADCLERIVDTRDAGELERASRLVRRIAMREEHFWGGVMNALPSV